MVFIPKFKDKSLVIKTKYYTVTPFWDKRFVKKDLNLNPILITVNLKRTQFRIGVKLYSTKEDFDAAMKGRGGSEAVKELRKSINDSVSKAEQILEALNDPTKETFLRLFRLEMDLPISKANKTSVVFVFQEKIAELLAEERIGTAANCKSALKSLLRYKKELYFEDIDIKFLKGYKVWMEASGSNATTVQIYLRNLKAIFNSAIKPVIYQSDYTLLKIIPSVHLQSQKAFYIRNK